MAVIVLNIKENGDYVIVLHCFYGFASLKLCSYIYFGYVTMLLKCN